MVELMSSTVSPPDSALGSLTSNDGGRGDKQVHVYRRFYVVRDERSIASARLKPSTDTALNRKSYVIRGERHRIKQSSLSLLQQLSARK